MTERKDRAGHVEYVVKLIQRHVHELRDSDEFLDICDDIHADLEPVLVDAMNDAVERGDNEATDRLYEQLLETSDSVWAEALKAACRKMIQEGSDEGNADDEEPDRGSDKGASGTLGAAEQLP